MSEDLIKKLEDEIENLEHMKFMFNERLEDAIRRVKKIGFDLKYGASEDLKKHADGRGLHSDAVSSEAYRENNEVYDVTYPE